MRGREGTLRASAGRSILRRFSASERPAAGHRAGRCRTSPSQGSRSKESSRDIKRNMYGFSARISTCGRRADRATSGPLRTVPSPRRPRIETLAETTYVLCLGPCPVTPLLRCDRRIDATTVSSMDGHIWRWAGNIPPGFEPEFEPRLAHYSECYTYTWFGSALQKHIHIQFGA